MGRLLVLQHDGIYTADGELYKPTPKPKRAEVLREYTKLPDPSFQRIIDRKVGRNPFGDPLYRVVWGWGRLDWCAGLFDRYSDDGSRWLGQQYGCFLEPKYSYLGESVNRWLVEKWIPPDMYGDRESWEYDTAEVEGAHTTQALGPFPSRGDYELSFVLQDPFDEGFLQLTHETVDMIVGAAERSRAIEAAKLRQAREEELERKEKAARARDEAIFEDAACAFGGNPNSTQANAPMHNTRKSDADLKVARFPVRAPSGLSVA